MKIDSGTVNMGSARSYKTTSVSFRRFTLETRQVAAGGGINAALGGNTGNAGGAEKGEGGKDENGSLKAQESQNKENSQAATLQDWQDRMQQTGSNVSVRSQASQTLAEIRHSTVRYIFELLFSFRRNRLNRWMGDTGAAQSWNSSSGVSQENQNVPQGTGYETAGGLQPDSGMIRTNIRVLNYTHETLRIEREDTAFSTMGTVRTADGREISFQVNVGMSREFQQHYQEQLEEAFVFCDPLVINLDTDIAELSDQTFYFDIDGDGEADEISGMGSGSGYLALDKNGDGIINDGSELFGTASGDGFADLARYDEDGNGWIDENDAVWDKLKIWCKDENGKDVLYRLADKGVGAICLQNVSTDFTLKGEQGRTKGAVRSSGVFLYEDGSAGTIQHVDVAKYSAQA